MNRRVQVLARYSYPSWDYTNTPFREQDYKAHFFVHALKGDREKIGLRKQRFDKRSGGEPIVVTRDNLDVLQRTFASWVAQVCQLSGLKHPVFVPIPNRSGFAGNTEFPTANLARLAARSFGRNAQPFVGLRFRKHLAKNGNYREKVEPLRRALHVYGRIPPGELVLVDDVYTYGRHVEASIKRLGAIPKLILVGAKTVHEPRENMMSVTSFFHNPPD